MIHYHHVVLLPLCLVFGGLLVQGQGQRPGSTASDVAGPSVEISEVIVPAKEFTLSALTKRSSRLMLAKRYDLRFVWFFASKNDFLTFFDSPVATHMTYGLWRRGYETATSRRYPVGALVAIRDSAVVLLRNQDRVSRRVIRGTDPTVVNIEGGSFFISYFYKVPANKPILTLYAWTSSPLTAELGERFLAALSASVPFGALSVRVRNDPWFVDDPVHPFFNPFYPGFAPPTEAEYNRSPTMACFRWEEKKPACVADPVGQNEK